MMACGPNTLVQPEDHPHYPGIHQAALNREQGMSHLDDRSRRNPNLSRKDFFKFTVRTKYAQNPATTSLVS